MTEVFQVSDTGVTTLELLSEVRKMISREGHRGSQLNFCITILGLVRHKSAILTRASRVDWGCFPPLRGRKPCLSKVTVWVDELVSWARRGGGDAINTNPDDRQTDRRTETPTAVQFLCVILTQASANRVCYYRSGEVYHI